MLRTGAVFSVFFLFGSPAAVAETSPDPLWYMDAMRIRVIHDAGVTGEGVTVAVFDSFINPDAVTLQGADIKVKTITGCSAPVSRELSVGAAERGAQHGTSVTSLLVGNGTSDSGAGPEGVAPGVRLLFYGVLGQKCEEPDWIRAAVADAVESGADIISFSGGFTSIMPEQRAQNDAAVGDALRAGTLIVAALPNDSTGLEGDWSTTNGIVNVAAVDENATIKTDVGGGPLLNDDVDVAAPGVRVAGVGYRSWGLEEWMGNSAATPIVSGVLALAMQKWPDATPEQLLQSLIRNTGSNPHELAWSNDIGYGVVNATRMMAEDPGQYPNENPLFKDDQQPSFAEVYAQPTPTPTPTADEPRPQGEDGASPLPWVIGGGAAAVIGIGVLVTILFSVGKTRGGRDDV